MLKQKLMVWAFSMTLLGLTMLKANAQTKKGFELQGDIAGLKDGSSIYLILRTDTVSIARSKKSKFIFKGYVDGDADWYTLKVDTTVYNVGKRNASNASNALWLVNSKLTVTGNVSDWYKLALTGSEPHNEYTEIMKATRNKEQMEKEQIMLSYISDHPNSLYISDLIIKAGALLREKGMEHAYTNLTPRAKNSYYGREVKRILDGNKGVAALQKNSTALDFDVTANDGGKFSILSIAKKSKYTLIDFWASWCVPCRAAIPELKKVYETFNSKGFNIISVSRDKDARSWKKALSQENMPWPQGLDNIHDAGKNIFNIMSIPAYVLIDQNGMIIQTDYFLYGQKVIIRKENEKRLGSNLHEIIDTLLKEEKSK